MRRLVCTGKATDSTLAALFGERWPAGVGAMRAQERRNYLLAAKSASWLEVKHDYDMGGTQEMVPALVPLADATMEEINAAEEEWSEWIFMQDWEVGEGRPEGV